MFIKEKSVFIAIREFRLDQRGIIAIMTVLLCIPILLLLGGCLDYSFFLHEKTKIQTAMDSTVLSLSHTYYDGSKSSVAQQDKFAQAVFKTAFVNSNISRVVNWKIQQTQDKQGIKLTLDADVNTFFLKTIGITKFSFHMVSGAHFPTDTIDISLALDNSSSMNTTDDNQSHNRIFYLQEAALLFTDILLPLQASSSSIKPKIAIVPFGVAVNVGADHKKSLWMDTRVQSTIHRENFAKKRNRFKLYDRLGIKWDGCVEVRQQPYDIHDFDPRAADMSAADIALGTDRKERFFVPWFLPDEPDEEVISGEGKIQEILPSFVRNRIYGQSYVFDNISVTTQDRAASPDDNTARRRWNERLKNVTKYKRKYLILEVNNYTRTNYGPNTGCTKKQVTEISDLSDDREMIAKKISSMQPSSSYTNILEGVTWAWRVLTPGEPFTKGSHKQRSKKYLVLLSDGRNTLPRRRNDLGLNMGSNPSFGYYSAFGLPVHNRLNIPKKIHDNVNLSNVSTIDALDSSRIRQLDKRTILACENIKNDGITLYTIAFGTAAVKSQVLNAVLSSCATSPSHHFTVESDLKHVFALIAQDITALHLNQ